jgi:ferredoxin
MIPSHNKETPMTRKLAPVQLARRIILGVLLVGLTTLTILHQKLQGIPSIDALDPFGGLETLMKWVAGGEFIKKIEPGTLVLFGGIIALGVVLSRFFCGWFCAFGALQGVFGWLGKKLFGRHFTVPKKLDAVLRYLKYPVLVAIIYFTWQAGDLVIRPYDPLAAYGHLSAGLATVWTEFAVGLVLLVLTLVLSMLYERAFCKYLCPLGAVNAILGRIPLFRIKRVETTCISCSKCDKACPMGIDVSHPKAVNSPECISCMECVTTCPTTKPSLFTSIGGKAVKTAVVVGLGFAIYFGAAAVGQAAGMLRFSAPTLKEQASAGSLKVEDIKGSSTWGAVAESFGIELERLYREAGVDGSKVPADTMLKDTAKVAGMASFEADTARVAVAKILGIPYAGEGGESKPAEAAPATAPAASAAAQPGATKATTGAANSPAPAAAASPAATTATTATLVVPADFVLEGTMTINDVATALKTTPAAVIAKLGLPANIPVDKPLRDMKDQYGYTMPALKAKFTP